MKILLLCTDSPAPPHDGAAMRSLGWMRTIKSDASVAVLTLARSEREYRDAVALRDIFDRVDVIRAPRTWKRRAYDRVAALMHRAPYIVEVGRHRAMNRALNEILTTWQPDLVQAERLAAATYLDQCHAVPTVYSAHNVESRIIADWRSRWRVLHGREAQRIARAESTLASRAGAVVAAIDIEASWMRPHTSRLLTVPNCIDTDSYAYRAPSRRVADRRVSFLGHLGYPPNRDAARIIAGEIFPLIKQREPRATCEIAGRAPGRRLASDLRRHGVTVDGDVPDAAEIWHRASALLCPLRWGAGSRLKLLEAAACGVPIVCNPFAAEGLSLAAGRDYIACESNEEFAAAVHQLWSCPAGADEMAECARSTVRKRHDWRHWRGAILQFYEDLIDHHRKERERIGWRSRRVDRGAVATGG
jgi:glycosyltransferase involved in cell wall biosynthesis